MLFTGPEGIGRSSLALALARALLCSRRSDKDACFSCENCSYFNAGTHPDFKHIAPLEGKTVKVDVLREEIVADIPHVPQIAGVKVYFIEADFLNEQGQNVLLKSLEEPPPYAYFLLTAREADRLLPTVQSRVSEIKVEALGPEELKTILKQKGQSENLDFLAHYAQGIPGLALALASREEFAGLREDTLYLFRGLMEKNYFELASHEHRKLLEGKAYFSDILRISQSYLRDLALLSGGIEGAGEYLINKDKAEELTKLCLRHREIMGLSGQDSLYPGSSGKNKESGKEIDQRLQSPKGQGAQGEGRIIQSVLFARAEEFLREIAEAGHFNVNYEILTWTFLQGLRRYLNPE